jgi:Asp-tRNA(Asn)/Glu-tRNA(Gln) amidotransferase A subunit family amidase
MVVPQWIDGRSIGVQLMAQFGDEDMLFRIGRCLESR